MKIVYKSNTGFTKRYACTLANKLNIECLEFNKYKKDNDEVIYMGWVFGNNIMGYEMMRDNNIKCVIAVGMSYESNENNKLLIETNKIDKEFFYLQGGVDYKKLKGIKKVMLKLVGKSVIKENKPENKKMIELFKNGGDFFDEKKLDKVVKYINKK